ncbi:MAG TPA: cytochrome P450, partial [Ktedonobacteraceae bacterium]|nr:cytochrome P450 [Ktedonobacteraceae bacterium]
SYADTMASYGEQLQQTWSDGEVIDLNQHMIAVTMSIIGKVLFDADVFTETDELGHAMAVLFEHITHTLTSLFAPPLNWPTPRNRRVQKATQLIQARIVQMIAERRDTDERDDFLSILLRARHEDGSGMSDEQLMDECITLFGAGHETTAAALTWVWYQLCQHPALYKKVQQEVDSVLQGRTPTYADLPNLPYCLQVFKETMRLYPPATGTMREALRDIEIDGYPVRKGTNVVLPIYTLHRHPRYFPEPETFDPDRFLPEREKALPRYAYLPFGAGSRICIGNHFAMMEGHLLIATLAQRATFSLLPRQMIAPDLTKTLALRPYGKMQVVTKRR